MLRCYQKIPSIVQPQLGEIRQALGDRDPSVMGAALALYQEMIVKVRAPCGALE